MSQFECPMHSSSETSFRNGIPQCPVPHNVGSPSLSQSPALNQTGALPTERVISSIPRSSVLNYSGEIALSEGRSAQTVSNWEYPSPQQFYDALLRKGWRMPEQQAEAMVLIHNRLNEDAWAEVLKWESRFGGQSAADTARFELWRFAGIHAQLSNKARLYQFARRFFPAYFRFAPPFDRHDWVVYRPRTHQKVRYVIDYYSSRKGLVGEPKFHLDVRPAFDSFGNIKMRVLAMIEGYEIPTVIVLSSVLVFSLWNFQVVKSSLSSLHML